MKKYLLWSFLALALFSCATGKNAFEKGNYETAIDRSINRLRSNPDNKKAQKVLKEGYKLASEYHLDYINEMEASTDPDRWEGIFRHYNSLNNYYDKIRRCPACMNLVNPRAYRDEEQNARQQAAEYQVSLGKEALSGNSIESGRGAFRHFNAARNYVNGYPGIEKLMEDARYMGTVRVLVEPIPIHSRRLALSNEFFENQILEFLERYERNRFVAFYTTEEAERLNMDKPDQVLSMVFDDFVIGQTLIESRTKEVSRDSVIVGQYTDNDGNDHDVYGTVKAEVTINRKTLASSGIMNFEIRDAYTNRVLTQRKLPSEDVWIFEWGSFNGDERALTDEELEIAQLKELPPPLPQDLFIGFVERIYDQIRGNIRNFYRNTAI